MHHFDLYREAFCDHMFSPCKRVTVYTVREIIDGEIITAPNQFRVYVNGKRVPDHQFSIRYKRKPKQAGKHRPEGVMPMPAEQAAYYKRKPMAR